MNEIYTDYIEYYFAQKYFLKYTNVLRWTIISWQALAEYLQIELSLKIKHSFSVSLIFRKVKIYSLLGLI